MTNNRRLNVMELKVENQIINYMKIEDEDYISITDMLKSKDGNFFVTDWLRKRRDMEKLKIKGIYKHFKGDLYLVEDIVYNSENEEKMIAYRALYGDNKVWVRNYDDFFKEVNKNGQKYRFELQKIDSKNVKEK